MDERNSKSNPWVQVIVVLTALTFVTVYLVRSDFVQFPHRSDEAAEAKFKSTFEVVEEFAQKKQRTPRSLVELEAEGFSLEFLDGGGRFSYIDFHLVDASMADGRLTLRLLACGLSGISGHPSIVGDLRRMADGSIEISTRRIEPDGQEELALIRDSDLRSKQ